MTNISRMPPFKAIEAFVVAARALSFTEAASVLNITVPAVSRRVQTLESNLGVPLFQRKPRALGLTQAGESYLSELEPAIDAIRRASHCARARTRLCSVRLSLPASLAANWLVPRLHHFHAAHRGIRVELESDGEHFKARDASEHDKLNEGEADIVIRLSNGNWPGLRTARLLDLKGFPVCSPSLIAAGTDPCSPEGLRRITAAENSQTDRICGRNGFISPACRRARASPRSSTTCTCSIGRRHAVSASRSASTFWCSLTLTTVSWCGRSIRNTD